MNIRSSAFVLVACSVFLAGCGGGGGTGSSGTDPITAERNGINAINSMLSDQTTINTGNLASANANFKTARSGAPNDRVANAGYAITLVALKSQTLLDLLGISTHRAPTNGMQSILQNRLASARFGFLGNAFPKLSATDIQPVDSNGRVKMIGLFSNAAPSRAYPTNPTYIQVYAALRDVSAALAEADTILSNESILPSDASPLSITDPSKTNSTVKIGTVEIRALRVAVQALESILDLLLAYNLGFDTTTYPYNKSFATTFGGSLNGAPILSSDYLPTGGFGKLNTDGHARMAAVPTMLVTAINTSLSGMTAYEARTGTGWILNPGSLTSSQISDFKSGANDAIFNLTHDQAVTLSGEANTLRIPEWFANAPANLVPLFPTIHYMSSQGFDSVSYESTDFSDLTFGGLWVSPIPGSHAIGSTSVNDTQTVLDVLGSLAASNAG